MNIEAKYKEIMVPLLKQIDAFPWESKECYGSWLRQTYAFVSRSTRFIMLAGSMFSLEQQYLHLRFIEYAKEERNHEILLENDLKHLGYKLGDFEELALTAAFYQAQTYRIHNYGPASFFGFVLCLEGLAVDFGKVAYERVVAAHGKKAGNFLKVHAEEDVEHLKTAFDLLSKFGEADLSAVFLNFVQSNHMYGVMLSEIEAHVKGGSRDLAA